MVKHNGSFLILSDTEQRSTAMIKPRSNNVEIAGRDEGATLVLCSEVIFWSQKTKENLVLVWIICCQHFKDCSNPIMYKLTMYT